MQLQCRGAGVRAVNCRLATMQALRAAVRAVLSPIDARTTAAWPRYEAEYLKGVLQDEKLKYDAAGLDPSQQHVYPGV